MESLQKRISDEINKSRSENVSNSPDFILGEYLINCLRAFNIATKTRDDWYGVNLHPANSYFKRGRTG